MSKRLTTAIREYIVTQVIIKSLGERERGVSEGFCKLGDAVYYHLYTAKDTALMDNAPSDAFVTSSGFSVSFGSNRVSLPMTKVRRMFYAHQCGWEACSFPVDHPLSVQYASLKTEEAEVKSAKKTLRSSICPILTSVTTVKRLLEAWPDAAAYLPKEGAPVHLPALNVEDVNALIKKLSEKKS